MNLPSRERTEEEQRYQHQVSLVRSLVDKGYSPRQIMGLSDVPEISLDKDTAKEILAYEDAGKGALKEMVGQTYRGIKTAAEVVVKSMFRPFSTSQSSELKKFTVLTWGIPNELIFLELLNHAENNTLPFAYLAGVLGINVLDGLHEIYKHKRDRIVKERLSKLEQIASGESQDETQ